MSGKLNVFIEECKAHGRTVDVITNLGKFEVSIIKVSNEEGKDKFLFLDSENRFHKDGIYVTKSEKKFIEKFHVSLIFDFYGDWICAPVKNFSDAKEIPDGRTLYVASVKLKSFQFKMKSEKKENFVHLHNHFEYSQLDGTLSAEQWLEECKLRGIGAIGLTDHGTLSGSMDFYLEAKKKEVKPILGMEAYITEDISLGREYTRHITLLARNNVGWRNLLKLNTFAQTEGFYYKPRITYDKLNEHGKGLIILTGCPGSKFSEHLREGDIKKARSLYALYCRIVGEENVYMEYQYHNYKDKNAIIEQTNLHKNFWKVYASLKWKFNPKVVVTNDCHYIREEDYDVWEAISKINRTTSEEDHVAPLTDLYLKTRKEIITDFKASYISKKINLDEFKVWMANTVEIADKCNVEVPVGHHNLPEFPLQGWKVKTKEELFDKIIKDGFKKKIVPHIALLREYDQRIQKEVKVIKDAGFIDYFLIIWDIIRAAKENGIFVGAARGSVAGSLVAYVMDITDIDPIKFDLLFERFLNETRVSGERAKEADALPDIDMDFESHGREWVKRYIEDKYGKKNVCSLATYGRLQLRAAIKDLGKSYSGISFDVLNNITRNVHGTDKEGLLEALTKYPDVEEFLDENPDVMKIVYRCMGQVRHSSIHPAGIIISPKHRKTAKGKTVNAFLDDFIPVKNMTSKEDKSEKVLVSEWEGYHVERRGLLKIDVLGIKQLDIFKDILKLIKKNHKKDIDLNDLDLGDSAVYEKFQVGDSEGVFQFKSRLQKDYQKKLHATEFEHLIAANALLRPGAMSSDAHNDFVAMKNGDKEAVFDKGLELVTAKTQGLYIYQEQIMQAMVVGGGLSLSEADVVRTAIKKFDREKMGKFHDKFIAGIKRLHKYNDENAERVWNKLLAFSGYGFNRSHSCSYAMIGYQCQWLKTYYPKEFWAVNMEHAGEDDRMDYVNRILNSYPEISFRYPDINLSDATFKIIKGEIIWGLSHIKGVGHKGALAIVKARDNGKFKSLRDFMDRVEKRVCNKRVIVALIYAGAFDEIYGIEKDKDDGKRFQIMVDFFKERKEKEELKFEGNLFYKNEYKRLIGINIVDWDAVIEHNGLEDEGYVSLYDTWEVIDIGTKCTIAGMITKIVERKTKKGDAFGIIDLQQQGVTVSVIIWNDFWEGEDLKEKIKLGRLIAIKGQQEFDSYRGVKALYTRKGVTELWKLKTKRS